DFGPAAGDRKTPDPAKLMDGGEPAHHSVVANLDVAGERPVIRKDNFVSNRAIVTDVTVGEKISATADLGLAVAFRASIHGHEFAKCIFVADFQIRRFARVF